MLQLQSLAFGSASEGKKKNGNKNSGSSQQNGCSSTETAPFSTVKESVTPIPSGGKEEKNGNGNCADNKNVPQRPKGISKEQWEQWQKRDADVSVIMTIVDLVVLSNLILVVICITSVLVC